MSFALALIAFVVVQRILETIYAARNARALLARGGVEVGRKHYPLIVALHACWLLALIAALPADPPLHFIPLILFLLLQALRIWVIATLGPYWTTRIITLPGAPLIRQGPYRFFRHPNYIIVTGEISALPLVFGEIWVAVIFSVLNAGVLTWRIRVENEALRERR
ncbi:MAG: isoprenylcysteine carboxyl methyltransferase family protein [Alphaproteobacteria bacterium]